MAEETTTNDDNDGKQGGDDLDQLRSKASQADAVLSENEQLKRELAFTKAGIDTSSGVGKLVFDSFKPGEDQEVNAETVLAYAAEYGVTPSAPVATGEAQGGNAGEGQQQQQGEQQRDSTNSTTATTEEQNFFATSGQIGNATDQAGDDADPYLTGYDRFDQAMKNGVPRETAAREMIGTVFEAAAKGDSRVLG